VSGRHPSEQGRCVVEQQAKREGEIQQKTKNKKKKTKGKTAAEGGDSNRSKH
jgi:hypothetical protein